MPLNVAERRTEQRHRFRADEDEDADDAQNDGNAAERDDADGNAVDPFESPDAAGGRRHLPAHCRFGREHRGETGVVG